MLSRRELLKRAACLVGLSAIAGRKTSERLADVRLEVAEQDLLKAGMTTLPPGWKVDIEEGVAVTDYRGCGLSWEEHVRRVKREVEEIKRLSARCGVQNIGS